VKSLGIRDTDTVYAAIKAAAERDKRSMANWIALAIDEKLTRSSEGSRPTAIAASDTRPKLSRHF